MGQRRHFLSTDVNRDRACGGCRVVHTFPGTEAVLLHRSALSWCHRAAPAPSSSLPLAPLGEPQPYCCTSPLLELPHRSLNCVRGSCLQCRVWGCGGCKGCQPHTALCQPHHPEWCVGPPHEGLRPREPPCSTTVAAWGWAAARGFAPTQPHCMQGLALPADPCLGARTPPTELPTQPPPPRWGGRCLAAPSPGCTEQTVLG